MPTIDQIIADPAASFWLKRAARTAMDIDPVKAANEAEVLAQALSRRAQEVFIAAIKSKVWFGVPQWVKDEIAQANKDGTCIACLTHPAAHGLPGCQFEPIYSRSQPEADLKDGVRPCDRCRFQFNNHGLCGCVPLDDEAP
ncbi:hypothetical protein LCGC14_2649970 [marine sediment metagenome]|uniref:Uncharacterized protein n=1 Tax=marine sediment metagenome TaxID=412755 RepID=A0A0F9CM31_9ZZZZ